VVEGQGHGLKGLSSSVVIAFVKVWLSVQVMIWYAVVLSGQVGLNRSEKSGILRGFDGLVSSIIGGGQGIGVGAGCKEVGAEWHLGYMCLRCL